VLDLRQVEEMFAESSGTRQAVRSTGEQHAKEPA
jgi:hypothetical protein